MVIAEALMALGLLCVLGMVGYACFKIGQFSEKKLIEKENENV